ncbi:MAG TPA: hypothetical protein VGW33_09225 [Terriglobia bacterium]|nr:hypothetical protein [Terriglobia bacterium]
MLTNLYVALAVGAAVWTEKGGGESPLATLVALAKVVAILAAAAGFLFLVARVSWAARQFVATCQERQQAQRKMVEMLREYLGQQPADLEQMWSASTAMAVC